METYYQRNKEKLRALQKKYFKENPKIHNLCKCGNKKMTISKQCNNCFHEGKRGTSKHIKIKTPKNLK